MSAPDALAMIIAFVALIVALKSIRQKGWTLVVVGMVLATIAIVLLFVPR